jgi:hypothetical protein
LCKESGIWILTKIMLYTLQKSAARSNFTLFWHRIALKVKHSRGLILQ